MPVPQLPRGKAEHLLEFDFLPLQCRRALPKAAPINTCLQVDNRNGKIHRDVSEILPYDVCDPWELLPVS